MGNCLLVPKGGVVEIVKPDGKALEYRRPVKVRKVLTDFPGHGISENLRQPPLWQLLSPETTLRSGRSYYLVPLPPQTPRDGKKKKKVRFVDGDLDSSVKLAGDGGAATGKDSDRSSSTSVEVVRIKMVITKKELMEMVARGRADLPDFEWTKERVAEGRSHG